MRTGWSHGASGAAWMMAGCLLGCGPLVPLDGATEAGSESEDGGTTTAAPPSTTTAPPGTTSPPPPPGTTTSLPPSDESTSEEPMTSLVFLDGFDEGRPGLECDLFAQDCIIGEKCMPWANDGGSSWNALRCSPIADDPDPVGGPCTVEGSGVSGIDSCEAGSMCWDVDPETLEGYCVAFCVGNEASPMCEDPGTSCTIGSDGPLALCIPQCDPLQQACPAGDACYPVNDGFLCVPDASGDIGAPGDECEFINVCDPGSACVNAELVPDCMGATGCCSAFCDVTMDPPPCLSGQECTPWYEAGQAPPGYENVGVCALPM